MLALEGVKILDLSRVPPGAFCTMILGDMGADVLKIETPGFTEFVQSSVSQEEHIRETAYDALNRNKKSIVLNLKTVKGCEVFHQLAEQSDVIVEGFRPGVAQRLGIDYDTIKKLNPKIIYCSLTGYGQDGPYRTFPGHDINYISFAGVLGSIGPREGHPVIPLNLIADFAGASLYGAIGILTALLARKKTRKGQYLDIAFTDGALALMTFFSSSYFLNGVTMKRGETVLHGAYPYYGIYQTKDGEYISLGCIEQHFWENLCRLLGREDYIPYHFAPEHFVQKAEDKKWEEINAFLSETFLTKTRDEWFELLIQHDIPSGKVYTLGEAFTDPQVLHRQMVIEVDDPTLGKIKQVGIAPKLSDTPGNVRSLSPLLGEHTDEILQGIGFNQGEIESLRKEGVIN